MKDSSGKTPEEHGISPLVRLVLDHATVQGVLQKDANQMTTPAHFAEGAILGATVYPVSRGKRNPLKDKKQANALWDQTPRGRLSTYFLFDIRSCLKN